MLVLARHIAEELLAAQIEQGSALIERASLVGDFSDYESWKGDRKRWVMESAEAVASIFASSAEAEEFTRTASSPTDDQPWQVDYASDLECVRSAVDFLISLQSRIESAPQSADSSPAVPGLGGDSSQWPAEAIELTQRSANGSVSSIPATSSTSAAASAGEAQIFVVHGRNEKRMESVVRLLEMAGSHQVAVLDDGSNDGRTLVEKFHGQAARSGYAVVVLTADDVGTPRLAPDQEPYFSPRARQGVVFQMGYLVGLLTPLRVCVLYEHGVELPSNLNGLAYVPFDLAGGWQSKLLLELRGAGFDYDPAKLAARLS